MAENRWNIRRQRYSANNGLNRTGRQIIFGRPLNRTQIACRFCNLVFMNTQAFIRHVESHMAEEESSLRRRQPRVRNRMPASQRAIFNSLVAANFFSLPTPARGSITTVPLFLNRLLRPPVQLPSAVLPQRHPFLAINRMIVAPPQRPRQAPPLQAVSRPMARRDHDSSQQLTSSRLTRPAPAAPAQAQTRALEPEETRPTDSTQPYLNQLEHPITPIVEVIDSNNDNSTISGISKLDLALKL